MKGISILKKIIFPLVFPFFILVFFLVTIDCGYAHSENGVSQGGFLAGFSHPISGLDHILAMMSVGLWGAFLGQPSIWMLPVVFPLIMSIGAVWGILGMPLPFVELGIVLSVIVFGLVIAIRLRPAVWVSTVMVGFFALFHGYAHGVELPANADALSFSMGFVLATGLLHLTGIFIGFITRVPHGEKFLQGGGLLISVTGFFLLKKIISG